MNKKYIYLIIALILIFCFSYFLILNSNNKEEKTHDLISNGYDETKKYYDTIDFSKLQISIDSNELVIVAIDDNTSFMYENFKELINQLTFKYEIDLKYLEISKLKKEEEPLFYEYVDQLNDYNLPIIVIFKDQKPFKIDDANYEELISEYKKMKEN